MLNKRRGVFVVLVLLLLVCPVFALDPLSPLKSGFNMTARLLGFGGLFDTGNITAHAPPPGEKSSILGFSPISFGGKKFSIFGFGSFYNINNTIISDSLSGIADKFGLEAPAILNPSALISGIGNITIYEPAKLLNIDKPLEGVRIISRQDNISLEDTILSDSALINLSSFGINASSMGYSELVLFRPAQMFQLGLGESENLSEIFGNLSVSDFSSSINLEDMLFRKGSLFSLEILGKKGLNLGYSESIISDATMRLYEIDPNAARLLSSIISAQDIINYLASQVDSPVVMAGRRTEDSVVLDISDEATIDIKYGQYDTEPTISLNFELSRKGLSAPSIFSMPKLVWYGGIYVSIFLLVILVLYFTKKYGLLYVWYLRNISAIFQIAIERRRTLQEIDIIYSKVKFEPTRDLYLSLVSVVSSYMEKKRSYEKAKRSYAGMYMNFISEWWVKQLKDIYRIADKRKIKDTDLLRSIILSRRLIQKY